MSTLRDLKIGESAVIESIGGEGATRQHLLDMGMTPGTKVKVIKFAPLGDPVEVRVRGYVKVDGEKYYGKWSAVKISKKIK